MGRPRSAARRNWPEGLYQNASGYFYWRDSSTGKSYGLGHDKPTAMAEARAAHAKRTADESAKTLLERIDISDVPSLAEWAEEWLKRISTGLADKTVKNHRSALRELVARCGHLKVCEITPKMIADVLELYVDAGKDRMAALIRATLMELFRAAEVRGHIKPGANPVTSTKVKTAKVMRYRLTLETFLKIHASQTRHWAKRSMELALMTAQRRQDVAAMCKAHIVDGHLQVDQGKSGGKTKLGIPLSLRLDAVGWSLEEVIARCRTPGVLSPYLVHHRTPGGHYSAGDPVDADTLSEAFASARGLASIEVEAGRTPPTFHEIRSLAIRLYKDQYGKEFAQALAGHKDMKTTLLYADPRDSQAQRILIPDPRMPAVSNEY